MSRMLMDQTSLAQFLQMLLTFFSALAASSGFWIFIMKKNDQKDQKNRLLMGLAHDRIVYLGMKYIERGFISRDEYENLHDYLYLPYLEMCGNGSAKRIMLEVDKLPIREVSREIKFMPMEDSKGKSNV